MFIFIVTNYGTSYVLKKSLPQEFCGSDLLNITYVVISPQLFCHLQYKHQQAICSNPLQEYIDH